jgi:hypothetical protein
MTRSGIVAVAGLALSSADRAVSAAEQPTAPPCFRHLIEPRGWKVPAHGKTLRSGAYTNALAHEGGSAGGGDLQ